VEIVEQIGTILKHLRTEKDVTLKEVSEQTGISDSLISKYERGLSEPGLRPLRKLADYYQVSLDYLFGSSMNKQPITTPEQVQDLFSVLTEDKKRNAIRYLQFLNAIPEEKE